MFVALKGSQKEHFPFLGEPKNEKPFPYIYIYIYVYTGKAEPPVQRFARSAFPRRVSLKTRDDAKIGLRKGTLKNKRWRCVLCFGF